MKKVAAPIILLLVGILMLFAGSALADAEEGAATSIGNFLTNTWVAVGLIVAGALWFAADEGYLKKLA